MDLSLVNILLAQLAPNSIKCSVAHIPNISKEKPPLTSAKNTPMVPMPYGSLMTKLQFRDKSSTNLKSSLIQRKPMATPTKRRKTNTYKPSSQTVGSLDFFFGKQREDKKPEAQGVHPDLQRDGKAPLTDEELARKLQLEWNGEDDSNESRIEGGINATATATIQDEVEGKERIVEGDCTSMRSLEEDTKEPTDPDENNSKPVQNQPGTLSLQTPTICKDTISSTIPFDENPLTFDPSAYIPDLKEEWAQEGGDASYGLLTRCFVLVNGTQSRIRIVDTLVNFLRTIIEGDPGSLLPAVSNYFIW